MIVINTSAVMAVLLDEPEASRCIDTLSTGTPLAISAGTLAEPYIAASRHGAIAALDLLLARLQLEVVPVTQVDARRAGETYDRWGKGIHPAGLNFGYCFAYRLAAERGAPLLYVGRDFSQIDIVSA